MTTSAGRTGPGAMIWPVFVISLPGCEVRRAPLLDALAAQGIACEVVLGVDGRNGLPPEYEPAVDRAAAQARLGRPISDAELACALSHQKIYQLIVDRGLPGAVVLEDDAQPQAGFRAFLNSAAHVRHDLTLFDYADNARALFGSGREVLPGVVLRRLSAPCHIATGYAVSARAAMRLKREGLPVRGIADWPCDITKLGARLVVPRLILRPSSSEGSTIEPSRAPLSAQRLPSRKDPARLLTASYWRLRVRRLFSARLPAAWRP